MILQGSCSVLSSHSHESAVKTRYRMRKRLCFSERLHWAGDNEVFPPVQHFTTKLWPEHSGSKCCPSGTLLPLWSKGVTVRTSFSPHFIGLICILLWFQDYFLPRKEGIGCKQKDLTSLVSFPPLHFAPCCCIHVPLSDQVTGSESCKVGDRLVEPNGCQQLKFCVFSYTIFPLISVFLCCQLWIWVFPTVMLSHSCYFLWLVTTEKLLLNCLIKPKLKLLTKIEFTFITCILTHDAYAACVLNPV